MGALNRARPARKELDEHSRNMGVPKEVMVDIAPESWLVWVRGTEEGATPSLPETDMLAAHDAVTTDSRVAQQK